MVPSAREEVLRVVARASGRLLGVLLPDGSIGTNLAADLRVWRGVVGPVAERLHTAEGWHSEGVTR
jgi:hypothetical protein